MEKGDLSAADVTTANQERRRIVVAVMVIVEGSSIVSNLI
jgi:hypothetical protein